MKGMRCTLAVFGLLAIAAPTWPQVIVDRRLPDYKPTEKLSGNLTSVGSDTMNNLMTLLGEEFEKLHPGVRIKVEGKGNKSLGSEVFEVCKFARRSYGSFG